MKLNTSKLHTFPHRMAVSAGALLALTALSAVAADYPTTVSSYHPVGYWRLNETTPGTGMLAYNQACNHLAKARNRGQWFCYE